MTDNSGGSRGITSAKAANENVSRKAMPVTRAVSQSSSEPKNMPTLLSNEKSVGEYRPTATLVEVPSEGLLRPLLEDHRHNEFAALVIVEERALGDRQIPVFNISLIENLHPSMPAAQEIIEGINHLSGGIRSSVRPNDIWTHPLLRTTPVTPSLDGSASSASPVAHNLRLSPSSSTRRPCSRRSLPHKRLMSRMQSCHKPDIPVSLVRSVHTCEGGGGTVARSTRRARMFSVSRWPSPYSVPRRTV